MKSTISVLALLSLVSAQDDPACSKFGNRVTCTYQADDNIGGFSYFKVPEQYSNMVAHIEGASGGAAMNQSNSVDTQSRGLGLKVGLQIADGLKAGSKILIIPGVNGEDAFEDGSGNSDLQSAEALAIQALLNMDKTILSGDKRGGNGGQCPETTTFRAAGAGGSGSAIIISTGGVIHQIHVGGGGGAGGSFRTASKGGDAAFILPYGQPSSLPGNPTVQGGHTADYRSVNKLYRGSWIERGQDAGGVDEADIPKYCVAGGGGGSGFFGGQAGSTMSSQINYNKPGGSGASGASILLQSQDIFNIIHQENGYSMEPKIVFHYDVPADEDTEQNDDMVIDLTRSRHRRSI